VQNLIAETTRLNIDIDFISTHFYPSDPNCTSNKTEYNGISASDPDCFAKALNKAQSFAADAGLPFLNTEYKDGLQGGNPVDGNPQTGLYVAQHGDLSYAAAFVMHNVPLLTNLDVWSYWTFTDVRRASHIAHLFCWYRTLDPLQLTLMVIYVLCEGVRGRMGDVWTSISRPIWMHDQRGHQEGT
jgi:hypothetical protein